jgi:hypothetical protein
MGTLTRTSFCRAAPSSVGCDDDSCDDVDDRGDVSCDDSAFWDPEVAGILRGLEKVKAAL